MPSSTQTSSPTPTATWINQKAGEVTAPILLYHHIASIENPSLYYISPETFKSQMEALKSWGYTSITIMQLIKVMLTGGELPVRPIVISFDDGDEDVYENAFPIMQQLGLTGTFFPIVEAIDQKGTVTHDQLKKMADSGWEIGSHSMTHPDLRDPKFGIRWEIYDSKAELEKIIGRPVEVFAYPFGIADTYIMTKTSKYGYKAAVGLGLSYRHDRNTLFYLNRIAIEYKVNLEDFGKLLPWSDMPAQ